jgi:titin
VTNTGDGGPGSLRQAILDSNASAGVVDTIAFNIGGGGVQTIAPLSALPIITDPVIVDGTTQPGFAGTPIIELDGSAVGPSTAALESNPGVGYCTVRGLVLNRFSNYTILLRGGHNIVEGNYVGTDVTGSVALPGRHDSGIGVEGDYNRIGTNGDGINDAAERNVVAGIQDYGVAFAGNYNVVAGNYIGTDATGTVGFGPRTGIWMSASSQFNRIGTNGDGMFDANERNVISGCSQDAIEANGSQNVIAGNYIGTDVTGTAAVPNGSDFRFYSAINVYGDHNLIGTNGDGVADAAERNVISGNQTNGISLAGNYNVVAGNFIGTDATGYAALGNVGVGVGGGGSYNLIGTNGDGVADEAERNVISGQLHTTELTGFGIITGAYTTVAGNYIGTDKDGLHALGNAYGGVRAGGGARIGTNGDGVGDAAERNIISGNNGAGINVFLGSQVWIAGNYIGSDVTGTSPLGNTGSGIYLQGASSYNTIGTNGDGVGDAVEGNLIAGNGDGGISIQGGSNNVVAGNRIGTDVTGMVSMTNFGGVGISAGGQFNRIGTNGDGISDELERNIIGDGVSINSVGGVSGSNIVAGNFIGVDASGQHSIPGGLLVVDGVNNRIGTNGDGIADDAERNVITVVQLRSNASGNVVAGNFIGTDATGTMHLLGLSGDNYSLSLVEGASSNRIGTDGNGIADKAESNVIAGEPTGVGINLDRSSNNQITGNYIGTDRTGTLNLGSGKEGIYALYSHSNQLGGVGALGNTIAFNARAGIALQDSVQDSILGNSIHDNGGLGIELLGSGNDNQAAPVLSALRSPSGTNITFTLASVANTNFRIEFYSNQTPDPSGYGEGQTYLGFVTVTTDANGNASSMTSPLTLPTGQSFLTATATVDHGNGSFGDSSEFALDVPIPSASAGGPYTNSEGNSITLDASGSSDPAGGSLAYSWDVNGDGVFGDATGVNPTLTWSQLNALGIKDGPASFNVQVMVTNSQGGSAISPATTLTVNNVAPTASLVAPSDGSRNSAANFTFTATDPSPTDGSTGFTYSVSWGDGSTQTINPSTNNGSGVTVTHTYTNVGVYTVSLTATDKDSGVSAAVTAKITISGAQIITDSTDSTKTALVVGGTSGNDTIQLTKSKSTVQVTLNGSSLGTFSPTGYLIVYGQDGNDTISVDSALSNPTMLYGGAGNDTLTSDNAANILIGGSGNDTLTGGNARDLLIGGDGADTLSGGNEDDILISGFTSYDAPTAANQVALDAIMKEWKRTDADYATRISHLQNGGVGALNDGYRLNTSTVFDDAFVDSLTGGQGKDWFLLNWSGSGLFDTSDRATNETRTDI